MVVPPPSHQQRLHDQKLTAQAKELDINMNNNNTKLNNNNYIPEETNNISNFYSNTKIFLTGATGFVGKALVEKLLRTCSGIDTIYVLMRPKRGMSVEQRLKELLKNPVYSKIQEKDPTLFDKVKVVSGDVALPNLGLDEADQVMLQNNVQIVFHSAATVKFNEDLKNAVILNTLGTKRVAEMCQKMTKLRSFVHVSTAYSNSDKKVIEEMVYDPSYDPNAIINCMDILPQEAINLLTKKLVGKHPNTYTITKAMAEHIVLEHSSTLPAAIVRPSIITAAWKEPFPGWVDNVSGITGIFMECGRGTIKTIICDENCVMDIIPVDIVVNTIVTAAWHTAAYRSNVMRVYNCTSGKSNPVTWKRFGDLTIRYSLEYPSKYVTWYPGFTYRTNEFIHSVCSTLYHTIPSAFLDVILYCTKQKPMMLKISNRFDTALKAGKFCSLNEWEFKTNTMESLIEAVGNAEDGVNFCVNMKPEAGFDWELYVKDFMLGVRQYILKDDISSLRQAKTKLNRLFWLQKAVQVFSMLVVFKGIKKLQS